MLDGVPSTSTCARKLKWTLCSSDNTSSMLALELESSCFFREGVATYITCNSFNKCAPLTLLAMERRERRRKASSKASTVVETKTEAGRKPAKLVLKASSALSPRGETDINVLHA